MALPAVSSLVFLISALLVHSTSSFPHSSSKIKVMHVMNRDSDFLLAI